MTAYIVHRMILMLPVLGVVGVVIFFLIHLTPGDPAAVMLGGQADPEQVAQLRQELGLTEPLYVQFYDYYGRALTGDLGTSIYSEVPVTQAILGRLGATVSLMSLAFTMGIVIAVPTAVLAVWKRDSLLDPAFMSVSILGVSIPNFWLALVLILVISVNLQLLPVSGYVPLNQGLWPWLSHLLMPAFVLAVQQAALIARMLRDGMLDAINQDYVRTARAKGLRERLVLMRHAFSNAMIPTITVVGVSVATLLGGAVITEQIFVIPGLGALLVDSISRRDFPVIQGIVLLTALVYLVVNLIVDIAYAFLDPRIHYD